MTLGVVAVTGAAGGLGSALCERLKHSGASVVGLVRPADRVDRILPLLDGLVVGSVDDPVAVREALSGATSVVNCAGLLPNSLALGSDAFERANVLGPETVLAEMRRSGPRTGVFLSTLGVVDHTLRTTRADLFRYRTGPLDAYASTKIRAEQLLLAGGAGLALSIVRPAFIYGPTCLGMWTEVIRAVKRGRMSVIGSGRAPFPVVYAQDLADFVIDLLRDPPEAGRPRVAIASDPTPVTSLSFMAALCAYYGLPPPRRIPRWIAAAAAAIADRLPSRLRLGPLALLTRRRVREYSIGYDLTAVLGADHFGFRARTSVATGVRAMLDAHEGRRT